MLAYSHNAADPQLCARCAALRQPTAPTGQNSCSEGLRTSGFHPFLPDRPSWQARASLRLLHVFTSYRLPLLGERYPLSSSVGVSKHWMVLAEALSGKEISGQGGCVAKDDLEVETTFIVC